MKERAEELMDLLKSLEGLKSDLMLRIADLQNVPSQTVYPAGKAVVIPFKGSKVYQFAYEGALPLYQTDSTCRAHIRHYYFRATFEAFSNTASPAAFKSAAVLILHYFQNKQIRDLDNRNRKFLLDALRHTRLIKDDSWMDISILEEGYHDPSGNHVQMYVLDRRVLPEFLLHMERLHRQHVIRSDPLHKQKLIEEGKEEEKSAKTYSTLQKKQTNSFRSISHLWE